MGFLRAGPRVAVQIAIPKNIRNGEAHHGVLSLILHFFLIVKDPNLIHKSNGESHFWNPY